MKIQILDTSFVLQSDEDNEYLEEIMKYYETKLEETRKKSKVSDPLKLAILTGMILIDELFKSRSGEFSTPTRDTEEAEKITLQLINTIAEALHNSALEPRSDG